MNKNKNLLILLFTATTFMLSSCEREYKINFDATNKSLVVEGYVENGAPPYLFLTKGISFFDSFKPEDLANNYVHNAKVEVSDGYHTIPLTEHSLSLGNNITVYFYTVEWLVFSGSGANLNNPFGGASFDRSKLNLNDTGKIGNTYQLKITLEGESQPSITATTELIKPNKVDSIWYVNRNSSATDQLSTLFVRVHNDPTRRNYVRYFTQVNGAGYLPGYNSVYDDQFVNGATFDFSVDRGVNKNQTQDSLIFKDYGFFHKGDTINVKFSQIDKPVFDFFQTLEYAYSNTGNPFAAPSNVKSNVKGALGVWCGYGSKVYNIVIPK